MALPCVVRMLSGIRQHVDVYLTSGTPSESCGTREFSLAGRFVRLVDDCGLRLSDLAGSAEHSVWYNYAQQTVALTPSVSNGILFRPGTDQMVVGGVDCALSATLSKHELPAGTSTLWAWANNADGTRVWEGLLDADETLTGAVCKLSLYALRGSPGVLSTGEVAMVLPQTEIQGMLALVCAAVAAVYLIGSASFYEVGRSVADVHGGSRSTKLFLADGPLTALTAAVAAVTLGSPEQQMPWVIWQRAFLCGSTAVLFGLAVYLVYFADGEATRASTLRTVVELPLLVAVYAPLASSASGVVDLAALLLGVGSILVAFRSPPVPFWADPFDGTAKLLAIWVQAPCLLAGVITSVTDGVAQGIAAVAVSLGICAASMHVLHVSQTNTAPPSP